MEKSRPRSRRDAPLPARQALCVVRSRAARNGELAEAQEQLAEAEKQRTAVQAQLAAVQGTLRSVQSALAESVAEGNWLQNALRERPQVLAIAEPAGAEVYTLIYYAEDSDSAAEPGTEVRPPNFIAYDDITNQPVRPRPSSRCCKPWSIQQPTPVRSWPSRPWPAARRIVPASSVRSTCRLLLEYSRI